MHITDHNTEFNRKMEELRLIRIAETCTHKGIKGRHETDA